MEANQDSFVPTGILFTANLSEAPFSLCSRAPFHGTSHLFVAAHTRETRVSPRRAAEETLSIPVMGLVY